MGLARTPPPKAGTADAAGTTQDAAEGSGSAPQGEMSEGNITGVTYPSIASPTRAFMPRKPGVMRSPPTASPAPARIYPTVPNKPQQEEERPISPAPEPLPVVQHIDERPIAAATRQAPETDFPTPSSRGEESMDIDESSTLSAGPEIQTPTRNSTTTFDYVTPARLALRPLPPSAGTSLPPATPSDSSVDASVEMAVSRADPAAAVAETTLASIPAPIASPETRPPRSTFTTPKANAPKTPRSTRKTPAEIAKVLATPARTLEPIPMVYVPDAKPALPSPAEPAQPEPVAPQQTDESTVGVEEGEDYGRRWKKVNETLQLVIDQILKKWTAGDLKKTLPTLAARDKAGVERVHAEVVANFRNYVKAAADTEFKEHKMGISLQRIDDVVSEAEEYEKTRDSDNARTDAWRPDLSPAALVMAQILPVYDEAWNRLRTEYLELHEDSRQRYASIMAKQAQLKELEGSVSDGVIELEQTIKLLDGFPNEDMMKWMEDKASVVGNSREP